jgi:hypothetical protein
MESVRGDMTALYIEVGIALIVQLVALGITFGTVKTELRWLRSDINEIKSNCKVNKCIHEKGGNYYEGST